MGEERGASEEREGLEEVLEGRLGGRGASGLRESGETREAGLATEELRG